MVLDTNLFIPAFAQPNTKVAQYQGGLSNYLSRWGRICRIQFGEQYR